MISMCPVIPVGLKPLQNARFSTRQPSLTDTVKSPAAGPAIPFGRGISVYNVLLFLGLFVAGLLGEGILGTLQSGKPKAYPPAVKMAITEREQYLQHVSNLRQVGNDETKANFFKGLFGQPKAKSFIACMDQDAAREFARLALSIKGFTMRKIALQQLITSSHQPGAAKILGEVLSAMPNDDPLKATLLAAFPQAY